MTLTLETLSTALEAVAEREKRVSGEMVEAVDEDDRDELRERRKELRKAKAEMTGEKFARLVKDDEEVETE
jgi:Na+/phosphate symporter